MNEKTMMTSRRGLVFVQWVLLIWLFGICGKIYNQPVWKLLGGSKKDYVTPYASLLPEGHTLEEYSTSLVKTKNLKSLV